MQCPKCEEGTIVKIRLKNIEQDAYLCDFCEALWFENEHIGIVTGHTLQSFSQGQDVEYSIEDREEKDQEHKILNGEAKIVCR